MTTRKSEKVECSCTNGTVYTPYITRGGRRIYRGKGKVFAFPCTRCQCAKN